MDECYPACKKENSTLQQNLAAVKDTSVPNVRGDMDNENYHEMTVRPDSLGRGFPVKESPVDGSCELAEH